MIGRLWRGWTTGENADAYEELLRAEVLPDLGRLEGYRGAYLLRRDLWGGVEFVTLTFWESLGAVQAFAGEDVETAVVPAKARALLSRFEALSLHYDTILIPESFNPEREILTVPGVSKPMA